MEKIFFCNILNFYIFLNLSPNFLGETIISAQSNRQKLPARYGFPAHKFQPDRNGFIKGNGMSPCFPAEPPPSDDDISLNQGIILQGKRIGLSGFLKTLEKRDRRRKQNRRMESLGNDQKIG
jgi:hypothetical protein